MSRTAWGQAVLVLSESADNSASTLRVYSLLMFGALVLLGPSQAVWGNNVESLAAGRKVGEARANRHVAAPKRSSGSGILCATPALRA